MIDESLYINFREIDGYNVPYNIISTTRGYGKTYGMKKNVINQWDKHKKRFAYLFRRPVNLQELAESGSNPFSDFNEDNGRSIYWKRRGFFEQTHDEESKKDIENQIGYNFIISKYASYKPSSYRDVSRIWFDECVIEHDSEETYLTKEPDKLQNICDTIIRNRDDVRVYLTCNALEAYNPYAIKWDLQIPRDGSYIWVSPNRMYLVYFRVPQEFIEARKNTLFGRAVSELDYAKFSFGNQFVSGNDLFIIKKPKGCKYMFTINSESYPLGVWTNGRYIYIDKDYQSTFPIIMSVSIMNQTIGGALIGTSNKMFQRLVLYMRNGLIFYGDRDVKEISLAIFKKYL